MMGFDSQYGLGIFSSPSCPERLLRPNQPHIPWVPCALSLGVKWPRHEADHLKIHSANELNVNTNFWGKGLNKYLSKLYFSILFIYHIFSDYNNNHNHVRRNNKNNNNMPAYNLFSISNFYPLLTMNLPKHKKGKPYKT
jgi:hypothetical protein